MICINDTTAKRLNESYSKEQIKALAQEFADLKWAPYTPRVEARLDELAKIFSVNVYVGR